MENITVFVFFLLTSFSSQAIYCAVLKVVHITRTREKVMNKGELIDRVAKLTDLSKRQTRDIIDITFETIKKNTKKKGGVQLAGFGSFNVTKRKARMGRNPQTGESIKIAASKNVRFKAGKAYKGLL